MSFVSDSRAQLVPRTLLVVLRVYVGILFLEAAISKLAADPSWTPNLVAFLERVALQRGHGFYQGFVQSVVLPNAGLFAVLVTWGELFAGLALVAGAATRAAAAGVMLLTLNYMLAKGAWFWHPSSNDAALFFIALVVIWGAAGRAFGADYFLSRRWPKLPLW